LAQRARRGGPRRRVELVDSTGAWLLAGIAVAAAIGPDRWKGWIELVHPDLQVLLLSLLGMPLYVCASGATPLAAMMMLNGISTGALFLIVGIIYERRHTRMITEYGGLSHIMPVYATVFLIMTLSSIGMPGLNGFIGEFFILQGTFAAPGSGSMRRLRSSALCWGPLHALAVPARDVRQA
jgi:NADH-quinone oxidoreductase subunit M